MEKCTKFSNKQMEHSVLKMMKHSDFANFLLSLRWQNLTTSKHDCQFVSVTFSLKNLFPPWQILLPNEVLVKLASLASLKIFGVSLGYLLGLYLLQLLTRDCFFPLLWGLLALKSGLKSSCNSFVSLSLRCTKGISAWQVCYKCSEFNEQDNKIGTNRILIISRKLIMLMNICN